MGMLVYCDFRALTQVVQGNESPTERKRCFKGSALSTFCRVLTVMLGGLVNKVNGQCSDRATQPSAIQTVEEEEE